MSAQRREGSKQRNKPTTDLRVRTKGAFASAKPVVVCAILGASAGVASAQSSVTVFGTLDLGGRYIKNTGSSRGVSMETDGLNSSQLVFSGKEDMGGGLWAGFELNSGINPDTGTSNAVFWNRRSVLKLGGNFGEIRLGRDYTPTFTNYTTFDPFGTNGIGSSFNFIQAESIIYVNGGSTLARADNMISYFTPNTLGGFYGRVSVAASEGAATIAGRYVGGRVGYASGPFEVAAAFAQQRMDKTAGAPENKNWNIAGSYNFDVVKLMGWYSHINLSTPAVDVSDNRFLVGGVVPLGVSEIHVSFGRSKVELNGTSNTTRQLALGYVYNLSKRTALYTTVSEISNGSTPGFRQLAVGGPAPAAPTLGGKSKGFEFGLRHFF